MLDFICTSSFVRYEAFFAEALPQTTEVLSRLLQLSPDDPIFIVSFQEKHLTPGITRRDGPLVCGRLADKSTATRGRAQVGEC